MNLCCGVCCGCRGVYVVCAPLCVCVVCMCVVCMCMVCACVVCAVSGIRAPVGRAQGGHKV